MKVTNWVSNPGFEAGSTGGFWNSRGKVMVEIGGAVGCPGAGGNNVMLWQQNGDTIAPSQTADLTVPNRATAKPGQWVRAGFRAWGSNPKIRFRSGVSINMADGTTVYRFGNYVDLAPGGADTTLLLQVPEGAVAVLARVGIQSDAFTAGGAEEVRLDNFYLYLGDTPDEVPETYFDGSFAAAGGYAYSWEGKAGYSLSHRVDTLDLVHWWTRKWWEFLPNAYQSDRHQNPENGGYPMLRYMEGVGRIAGQVRDLTDSIWAGEFMNPATAPDSALLWLAQLMGTDEQGRELSLPELREYLVDMSAGGRVAVGTKSHIQAVAKTFLTNDRRVAVVPSKERLHSLILVVAENDLPKLDGPAFIAKVRASGVVPAGHEIVVSLAVSTWDGWTTAAGPTWADLERNVKTWAESDALGTVLE